MILRTWTTTRSARTQPEISAAARVISGACRTPATTMTLCRTCDPVMFGKKKLMRNCGPADEAQCETSENGERLLDDTDLLPVNLGVGQRLLELFGNQDIASLVFRLR